jgi:hypothetical protein
MREATMTYRHALSSEMDEKRFFTVISNLFPKALECDTNYSKFLGYEKKRRLA